MGLIYHVRRGAGAVTPLPTDTVKVIGVYTHTVDVLTTATTLAPANIDPATVDLEPATPGLQQSTSGPGIIASVDPVTGIISVTGTLPVGSVLTVAELTDFLDALQYTVSDSNGVLSNIATISILNQITYSPRPER